MLFLFIVMFLIILIIILWECCFGIFECFMMMVLEKVDFIFGYVFVFGVMVLL